MSDDVAKIDLVTMTAEIVASYAANNALATGEIGALIGSVHTALAGLGAPEPGPTPEKPKGAVSVRRSLSNPAHILSMIDGKPYKLLKRHIGLNGYTPESYREAFGLPRDYPMVTADYADNRREVALKSGLGRKAAAPADEPRAIPAARKAKATPATPKEPARRGLTSRTLSAAIKAAKGHLGSE